MLRKTWNLIRCSDCRKSFSARSWICPCGHTWITCKFHCPLGFLCCSSYRNKRKQENNEMEGPVPQQVKRRTTNVLSGLLSCNIPNRALTVNGCVGGSIEATQLHASDSSFANQPEIEQPNVLHNANLAESQEGMQLDILASSEGVKLAVKRYFEPDDQPVTITEKVYNRPQ